MFLEGAQDLHVRNVIKYCKQKSATYCFSVFLVLKILIHVCIHLLKQRSTSFLKQFNPKISGLLLFLNLEENNFAVCIIFFFFVLLTLGFLSIMGIIAHKEDCVCLSPKENNFFFRSN